MASIRKLPSANLTPPLSVALTLSHCHINVFIFSLALIAFLTATLALFQPLSVSATMDNNHLRACATLQSQHGFSALKPVRLASLPEAFCASIWAEDLGRPRGLLSLPDNKGLLMVNRDASAVVWMNDTDGNGMVGTNGEERVSILTQSGINHGISFNGDKTRLLVSSATTVFSFPFDMAHPSKVISSSPTIIVRGMPDGGHVTRTLLMDESSNLLYVSIGSLGNIDTNPLRGLIARFNLSKTPKGGWDYSNKAHRDLFARGLRNEVALALDKYGVVWGAGNGIDNLLRDDLGGNIHDDNPSEEINKFSQSGRFFGYPYCWSEYYLPISVETVAGTQWCSPEFLHDGIHSDEWCRNESNVVIPMCNMQAHTAPLGMLFYPSKQLEQSRAEAESARQPDPAPFAFPSSSDGHEYLYVGQHGSWNREPPVGYKVQRFLLSDSGSSGKGMITQDYVGSTDNDFFSFDWPAAELPSRADTSPQWNMRPVDVALGSRGEMYVSNSKGSIVGIRYVQHFNASAATTIPLPWLKQPSSASSLSLSTIHSCLLSTLMAAFCTILIPLVAMPPLLF